LAEEMIALSLPYPPSVNSIYNHYKGHWLLSKEGRAYHTRVFMLCRKALGVIDPIKGRIRLSITAYPPDRRKRDMDNLLKSALDSLTKARLWQDDSQVDDLRIIRADQCKDGRIDVAIEEIV
jgi:crossover junction endodeoxyribonuclease RusA